MHRILAGILILVCVLIAGALLLSQLVWRDADPIFVSDVTAHPIAGSASVMVVAEFANPGAPDRLMDVRSDVAKLSILKSPRAHGLPLPSGSSPSLAMEAGHIMLMSVSSDLKAGAEIPMTLVFERFGQMDVTATVTPMAMQHGRAFDVPRAGAPTLELTVSPDGDRWIVEIKTRNFRFAQELVDTAHQPGTGHGHLYVEGMKIGRIFSGVTTLGALPPGEHEIVVTLNTNDHQAYAVDGVPIEARMMLRVD